MREFKITEEQLKQQLDYLWKRPYGEVAALIGMLVSILKPVDKTGDKKSDGVTPKKQ